MRQFQIFSYSILYCLEHFLDILRRNISRKENRQLNQWIFSLLCQIKVTLSCMFSLFLSRSNNVSFVWLVVNHWSPGRDYNHNVLKYFALPSISTTKKKVLSHQEFFLCSSSSYAKSFNVEIFEHCLTV